jgi:hypothetical protein
LEDATLRLLHGKPDEVVFFSFVRLIADGRTKAPASPWGDVARRIAEAEFYDPEDKIVAIRALGILRHDPARHVLERASHSEDSDLRAAAEEALKKLEGA